ncbi:MAG: hypothetical protein P8178_15390 [Candidatus Thiodiazotropha sp.]
MSLSMHRGIALPLLSALLWGASATAEAVGKPEIIGDIGLATPESVEYYADQDLYLVTNINGDPTAADGNGFITQLKPDGSVAKLKWIDGESQGVTLNAPKGAAVVGEHLFIADLNQVHVFELPSGRPLRSIDIPGSTFLNGITPGDEDSVYVTDSGFGPGFKPSGTDAVYHVRADGSYETVVKGESLGHPNGIWFDHGKLVVVTLGTGKMMRIDSTGKVTPMPTPPAGRLDGLLRLSDGHLVLSSWEGAAVYRTRRHGSRHQAQSPADSPLQAGQSRHTSALIPPAAPLKRGAAGRDLDPVRSLNPSTRLLAGRPQGACVRRQID